MRNPQCTRKKIERRQKKTLPHQFEFQMPYDELRCAGRIPRRERHITSLPLQFDGWCVAAWPKSAIGPMHRCMGIFSALFCHDGPAKCTQSAHSRETPRAIELTLSGDDVAFCAITTNFPRDKRPASARACMCVPV